MHLVFATGSAIRRVFIKDRKVTFIAAELKFQPLVIELDKLEEQKEKMAKMKFNGDDMELIESLAELGTEEEIAQDIINDIQKTGWRLIRKE